MTNLFSKYLQSLKRRRASRRFSRQYNYHKKHEEAKHQIGNNMQASSSTAATLSTTAYQDTGDDYTFPSVHLTPETAS